MALCVYEMPPKCTSLFSAQTVGSRSASAHFYSGTGELVENTSVQVHEM